MDESLETVHTHTHTHTHTHGYIYKQKNIKKNNQTQEMIKTDRIEKWDILKCLLIFLVVLGHILEIYLNHKDNSLMIKRMRFFIYAFHMPLFLFVSGLFSKKNIDNKRYVNIFFYLVIFYVTKTILFIANVLINNKYNFSMFSESDMPWYVFALFVFNIITIPISKLNKKFVLIFSLILGCIVGYDSSISDFLCLSRIIVFYPFFFIGYCLDANKVSEVLSKKTIKIISCLIILLSIFFVYIKIKDISWISPLLSGRNPFNALGDKRNLGLILRAIYYIIVTIIGISIISLVPSNSKIKLFSNIGTKTLQIYALHYPILYVLFFGGINLNIWIDKIMSKYSSILLIPIAFLVVLFCSLKIFEKPFIMLKDLLKNNKYEDKRKE